MFQLTQPVTPFRRFHAGTQANHPSPYMARANQRVPVRSPISPARLADAPRLHDIHRGPPASPLLLPRRRALGGETDHRHRARDTGGDGGRVTALGACSA